MTLYGRFKTSMGVENLILLLLRARGFKDNAAKLKLGDGNIYRVTITVEQIDPKL